MEENKNIEGMESLMEGLSEAADIVTEGDAESNGLGVALGVVAAGVVGLGGLLYAMRDRIKDANTKRWFKRCPAGYKIVEIEDDPTANDKIPDDEVAEILNAAKNTKKK